jgi:hypothetical protein
MKKQLLTLLAIACSSAGFAQSVQSVMNNGMESWTSQFGAPVEPTNYVTANIFKAISTSNPTSVTQATGVDACAGTYAAQITTIHLSVNPSGGAVPNDVGVAIYGSISLAPSFALVPGRQYTDRLVSLDVCYKYAPVNGDNGGVASYLTKWNGTSRDTIAAAYLPLTTTVSTFTQGSAVFIYDPNFPASMTPDSLRIYFLSSANPWVPGVAIAPQVGSTLWIDNATAVSLKSSAKLLSTEIKAYPNPATSFVTISSTAEQAVSVDVFDITGKKITEGTFDEKKVRIETAGLAEGLYLYSVKDKNKKVIATGKVHVTR